MGKIVAAINLTIDGFCDHTALSPGADIHEHYRNLIDGSEAILYGRKTFELMEYWKPFLENPSGEKTMDDFAKAMDRIPKIVFSNTLENIDWHSASLSKKPLAETVTELKKRPGKDILVGSRSLIVELSNLDLVDEYQLCVHPVVVGKGLPLFDKINERIEFNIRSTKTFESGAILLYCEKAVS